MKGEANLVNEGWWPRQLFRQLPDTPNPAGSTRCGTRTTDAEIGVSWLDALNSAANHTREIIKNANRKWFIDTSLSGNTLADEIKTLHRRSLGIIIKPFLGHQAALSKLLSSIIKSAQDVRRAVQSLSRCGEGIHAPVAGQQ
ncbi:MAG: hypothetical protein Q9173_005714, partial [Seirophora scorigena]